MAQTYDAIASYTFGSAASSYTFNSIAASWTDLILVYVGTSSSATSYLSLQFNSDTTSNYSTTHLRGTGSVANSTRYSNQTEMYASVSATVTTTQNNVIAHIMNYANTTTYKTILFRSNNADVSVETTVGLWRKTPEAINSIKVSSPTVSFASGTTLTLYGVKSA